MREKKQKQQKPTTQTNKPLVPKVTHHVSLHDKKFKP